MGLKRFLFPRWYTMPALLSLGLLVIRLVCSFTLLTHGWVKLRNFDALASGAFPDPIGLGSTVAVSLAIFAELVCAAAVALGFLHRLALIPIIITMAVAFFGIHSANLQGGELCLVYLTVFTGLYVTGPGKYSLDALIPRIYR